MKKMKTANAKTTSLFNTGAIIGIAGSGLLLLSVVALFVVLPAKSSVAANPAPTKSITKSDIDRARNYFTDTELTTHEGVKVRFYSDVLDGRIVMINVMYTNCKGSCPLLTQKLSQVSRELGDLYGQSIHFVSISNDAERDTPEVLAEFARKQNVNLDGWTFLTGPKQDVDAVIKKIGLYTPRFEQHKAIILLGNTRTGRWQKVPPNLPYQAMAVKLKELAGGA
jgi:cytochrome oxidase Cu insertion factor (SCO1/SenC/PrrC family)